MFYPIQIAPIPGFGFSGGPEFSTNIKALQSGREKRNADWSICRHKYTVPFKNISDAAYLAIKEVFLIVRGKNHTFLHKDWADYTATNQLFGTGDGTTAVFQLQKVSALGGGSYTRTIDKPADGATFYLNGVLTSATYDTTTGLVTFSTPPAIGATLTWTGEFFVHVRFDNDSLPFSLDDKGSSGFFTNGSIDLIEVLDE